MRETSKAVATWLAQADHHDPPELPDVDLSLLWGALLGEQGTHWSILL
jgi:hypothetical protein